MSEAAVVNLFLTVRVILVGGILIALPRITRKGLLFGVYVGEEIAASGAARGVRRSWDIGCLVAMAIALAVGLTISALGYPVPGNLTGTAVLLLSALVLYVRSYKRVRALIPPDAARQARRATASLLDEKSSAETFAKITLFVCLLGALAVLVYASMSYGSMPDRVPSFRRALVGRGDWSDKSILAVLYTPSVNLVFSPFFALLGWLTATAKRSFREGSSRRMVEAQESFRSTMTNLICITAILLGAGLGLFSVQLVRVWRLEAATVGAWIWWYCVFLVLFLGGSMFRIMKRYGQGGSMIEREAGQGALTGGLADNARWFLGMFYVDRDDPAMMVEKRFGYGYTLNYGNRYALAITIGMTVLVLSLAALGFLL